MSNLLQQLKQKAQAAKEKADKLKADQANRAKLREREKTLNKDPDVKQYRPIINKAIKFFHDFCDGKVGLTDTVKYHNCVIGFGQNGIRITANRIDRTKLMEVAQKLDQELAAEGLEPASGINSFFYLNFLLT